MALHRHAPDQTPRTITSPPLADVVETVAGGHARTAGSQSRGIRAGRIDALIEVDLTGERTGVAPDEVVAARDEIADADGLSAGWPDDHPAAHASTPRTLVPSSRELRALRDRTRGTAPEVLELSMGMSLDYQVAVEEGATMVRVGTALFGPRVAVDVGRT